MKRIILDTNIYGVIAMDEDRSEIVEKIKISKIIVYGFKTIRGEIRDVPMKIKIGNKSFRVDLLNLYDILFQQQTVVLYERETL